MCCCSVYCGHQSILVPPVELETDPALWLSAVSQHRVRDTFCSYSAMELCTRDLGAHTDILRVNILLWYESKMNNEIVCLMSGG